MELPRIKNDKSKKMEYKGQIISVNQIAKITGFSADMVRKNLRRGMSIETLLKKRPVTRLVLTKEQEAKRVRKQHTKTVIKERLANGWDIDLALELGKSFVGPVEDIRYKKCVNGVEIDIPYEEVINLEKIGITTTTICIRVGKGMSLKDAMTKPVHEMEQKKKIKLDFDEINNIEKRRTQEALQRYREEKARERMNNIKDVPQQVKLSQYGRYLMDQPLIARIKTDKYGNTQLI